MLKLLPDLMEERAMERAAMRPEPGAYDHDAKVKNGTYMDRFEYEATRKARKDLVIHIGLRNAIRVSAREFDDLVREFHLNRRVAFRSAWESDEDVGGL